MKWISLKKDSPPKGSLVVTRFKPLKQRNYTLGEHFEVYRGIARFGSREPTHFCVLPSTEGLD